MSTRGAVGESFFRVRLILVLALVAAVAGFIAGNHMEWRELSAPQMQTVHAFEMGAMLTKLHSCAMPRAPQWIKARCKTFAALMSERSCAAICNRG